ncbi:MAG: HlyD family efflux transporter periplasmic adaptor subunit [bacterium]
MQEQETKKESILKKPWFQSVTALVVIFGTLLTFILWQSGRNTVLIENSTLQAPVISLSPMTPGVLNALYVKEGDHVTANTQIALVGSQVITAQEDGVIFSAPNVIGTYFAPGQPVVTLVKTGEMKVVGTVDETKGLKDIAEGQLATFTVDAFPGKKFTGVVDSVSAAADNTGVVFSISDKRPIQKFDVKVRFDTTAYPELKSGMSAKITVSTK